MTRMPPWITHRGRMKDGEILEKNSKPSQLLAIKPKKIKIEPSNQCSIKKRALTIEGALLWKTIYRCKPSKPLEKLPNNPKAKDFPHEKSYTDVKLWNIGLLEGDGATLSQHQANKSQIAHTKSHLKNKWHVSSHLNELQRKHPNISRTS